jgi:hypothetical protein
MAHGLGDAVESPVLLVVGDVVGLHARIGWFGQGAERPAILAAS